MLGLETARRTRATETKWERLRQIIKDRSFIRGTDFTLSSGRHSGYFFDMKKTMFHPEGANMIAALVYERIVDDPDVTAIGGLEMGAVPVVVGVCMHSHHQRRPIDGFFVRKGTKGHGTNRLIDGNLSENSTVVMLDDVTTTGGSVMKAVEAVQAHGCKVKKIITVVDRLEGAQENLMKQGIALEPIFTTHDFLE